MESSALADSQRSSPLSDVDDETVGSQDQGKRQSRRARRKPELFSSQSYSNPAKRKRTPSRREGGEDDDDDAPESATEPENDEDEPQEDDSDDGEAEPEEEELKERKRAARRRSKGKAGESKKSKSRHAPKKPKIANGLTTELTLRPVTNGQRPAAKKRKAPPRPSGLGKDEEGLFAEVFARGHTTDAVAAEWLTKYDQHNVNAMCELVNFVLRCAGTHLTVTVHDIEDVDNVPNKLSDLQEEYQAESITDYPLISRSKKYRSFQSILTGFFESLFRTFHSSSVLYTDNALIENIQVWIAAMSSTSIRPFRHTSTVISLAISTTLCHLAREVSTTLSNSRKQLETEKKKKSVNKGRVAAMESKVQEFEKKIEVIDDSLRDSFDTVFVHRYRDVDPKIRAECMNVLGEWIGIYKEMFFDGQFLRYLGWILSDTVAQVRAIVIHQLHKLYQNKDNIAGLRSFTERFRPRIVEMAARDAEVSVRAATIDLLDLIRDAGLLEPDDIDTVGRLIFDIEPRVRKAAGRFFVASVQDVYEATIEGMDEELGEVFADEDEDDFESPKRSWIKYKCLADTLQTYDGQESDVAHEQGATALRTVFAGGQLDSRYALAAEAIYPHFKELDQWESLAGYLLYDHSQIPDQPDDEDSATSVSCLYKLSEGQEAILLQVLGCAVKLHIQAVSRSDTDKRGRKTKQLVERMEERQETTANNLSQIIPQLLNKFGAVPETASAVLRLEHLVDLNLIQDLQKDAAAYSDLISNINKQFLTHSDQTVLAEATVAFLHAQTSDELKEAMESKVQELWDDTTDTLRTLAASKQLDGSQSLSTTVLTTLMNTVMRLSNLVSISDCTSTLETIPKATSKRQKREPDPPVDILLSLAGRGLREDDADEEISALEKEIVTGSFKTLLVYFMWKIQAIKATLSSSSKGTLNDEFFDELSHRRDSFVSTLSAIMQQRSGIDDIRLSATTTLLDLQAAFGTLRNAGIAEKGNAQALDENVVFRAQGLPQEILPETRSWISRIHDAAERYFARKSGRKLEPGADDEPMDSESEIGISSDEDEDSAAAGADNDSLESRRTRAMLLAEQKLCQLTGKIVLAIVARVLGATGPDAGKLRQKLLKNKTRLGPNYKEVLAYLEERKTTTPGAGVKQPRSRANGATAAKKGSKSKSSELVNDDDDEDNESEIHQEEDDDEDLQARGLVEERDGGVDAETPRTPQTPAEDDIMGD